MCATPTSRSSIQRAAFAGINTVFNYGTRLQALQRKRFWPQFFTASYFWASKWVQLSILHDAHSVLVMQLQQLLLCSQLRKLCTKWYVRDKACVLGWRVRFGASKSSSTAAILPAGDLHVMVPIWATRAGRGHTGT